MPKRGASGSELRIASLEEIQQSMIPKLISPYPDRDDIDVYGLLEPAKYVGGDLFDYPSAMRSCSALATCQEEAIGGIAGDGRHTIAYSARSRPTKANAARIMDLMNESMSNSNESMMKQQQRSSVLLDLPTGRLRYCNAGHNAPLIVFEERKRHLHHRASTQNVHALPVVSNVPLGIMPNHKFEGQEIDHQTTWCHLPLYGRAHRG